MGKGEPGDDEGGDEDREAESLTSSRDSAAQVGEEKWNDDDAASMSLQRKSDGSSRRPNRRREKKDQRMHNLSLTADVHGSDVITDYDGEDGESIFNNLNLAEGDKQGSLSTNSTPQGGNDDSWKDNMGEIVKPSKFVSLWAAYTPLLSCWLHAS